MSRKKVHKNKDFQLKEIGDKFYSNVPCPICKKVFDPNRELFWESEYYLMAVCSKKCLDKFHKKMGYTK